MFIVAKKQQQGVALIVVLLLLLLIMVLALSIAMNSTMYGRVTGTSILKLQAFQAASSGADTLLELINKDETVIDTIPGCNKAYNEQYPFSVQKESEISTHFNDKRHIAVAWFACIPVDDEKNKVVPRNCDADNCFAVIITGAACLNMGRGSGTVKAALMETTPSKQCIVSRHLQSYMKD